MFWLRLKIGIIYLALAGLPAVLALNDLPPEDLAENRRLFDEWRQDPEHLARLQHNRATFRALPGERQDQIRQLDRDLHDLDSVNKARLWRVMERYEGWLERLSETDRRLVVSAPTVNERLKRIHEVRERQWIADLPAARREQLSARSGKDKESLASQWRQEERRQRDEWRVAVRHWDELMLKRPLPSRLSDFPINVQNFVENQLVPMLNAEEANRLKQAEGHWPLYPVTLVELYDSHPHRLPGPTRGPSTSTEILQYLPGEVKTALEKRVWAAQFNTIKNLEGKWPDYAIEWLKLVNRQRRTKPNLPPVQLPPTVAPSRPKEFAPPVQRFIKDGLIPSLSPGEKERLDKAEGNWPLYPETMLELANQHKLEVPGMRLPGQRENWDRYRALPGIDSVVLPEPPESALRNFFRVELIQEEGIYNFSVADPFRYEWMKKEYFKKNPSELERLKNADKKKFERRSKVREVPPKPLAD